MVQVQLRLTEEAVKELDKWIKEGRFKSRSDAIRTIVELHEEREKTREFYEELSKRREEAEENPEILIPLEDLRWNTK